MTETLNTHNALEITDTFENIHPFMIEFLASQTHKNILVIHHNVFQAQKLYETLSTQVKETYFFPQDELVTTEMLAMSEAFKHARLNTIHHTLTQEQKIVVTNPTGYIKPLISKQYFEALNKPYKVGQTISINDLKQVLVQLGYTTEHTVEKPGDFAHRGSIIDIFQPHFEHPIRIDFFDDEIDSIRVFNVNTQRSIKSINAFTLSPRVEFFYDEQSYERLKINVLNHLKENPVKPDTMLRIEEELEQLKQYQNQDALNRYIRFLDMHTESLSDYLDDPLVIVIHQERYDEAMKHIVNDYSDWILDSDDYGKVPFELLKDPDTIYQEQWVALNVFPYTKKKITSIALQVKEATEYHQNFQMLIRDLKRYDHKITVLITLSDAKQITYLMELLEDQVEVKLLGKNDPLFEKRINVLMTESPLNFEWLNPPVVVLNERNILKTSQKQKKKMHQVFKDTQKIEHIKALEKGDYLVHYDHGIGRFLGIETIALQHHQNDYIMIAYRGDDKLYIPIENIHLVQKYVGHEGFHPKLNKLGSAEWQKTKQRVQKKAKDIAEHLLKLYSERAKAEGFAFSEDSDLMHVFEADFMYEETPDQQAAIEAVKQDMESTHPMDRLICGDVGYGKTEIALRAAFKAALDNKQVAYLAPTTVLSRQHYYTFKSRMETHGIKVALLNRFVTKAQQNHYLKGIETGKYDIIIGTHRLLSKDVKYRDLGLLIIDEEQRFGVEHKAKIQTLKTNIDVLSLSATPIPRTLQMALTGVKQMSLLETPPQNRIPIQTYVMKRNQAIIKDAIERELARQGQTFYLFNRVEGIESIYDELSLLVPDARIVFAHGQMPRLKLESVISKFIDHEYDVLISTTIIETGIDIPNANTLIVHDADRLGLSQLYQIRGRVGRSDKIAYSYLMYQPQKILTEDATKRLQVIKDFTALGSGYKIAARDLAIRGAGDILGTEQSGFIDSVGIDLFLEMIKEQIDIKQNPEITQEKPVDTNAFKLKISRTIPNDYVWEEDLKMSMHKAINQLTSKADIDALILEFTDRYGKIPTTLLNYMYARVYEHLASVKGIEKVFQHKANTRFILNQTASQTLKGALLFETANQLSKHITLAYKNNKIEINIAHNKLEHNLFMVMISLLETL